MEDFLPEVSDELKSDLFQLYWETYLVDTREEKSLYDFALMPGAVINLFHGLISEIQREFSDAEWDIIRDAINEAGETMDLGMLQTLAGYLVEKGRY